MRYVAEIEMGSCAHRRLVRVFLSVVDGSVRLSATLARE